MSKRKQPAARPKTADEDTATEKQPGPTIPGLAPSILDDRDAWLSIPEFGVRPAAVEYEGFAYPVLNPRSPDESLAKDIASLIGSARTLARREFSSLKDLASTAVEAFAALEQAEATGADLALTDKQWAAVLYQVTMLSIRGGFAMRSTPARRMHALVGAASTITNWAMYGAAVAFERRRAANRTNARQDRPGARVTDHDELCAEFMRLVREGHSEGNARGILVSRGIASQPTIYRATKKGIR